MEEYFLRTCRIGFGLWSEGKIRLARSLWGDSVVTRYIARDGVFSEEDIAARLRLEIQNQQRYGVQYWSLYMLETGEFAGCCGLRPFSVEKGEYELGFHLKKEFWGKGLAQEAAKAVMTYSNENLHAKTLVAGHHPQNLASGRLLEKLGFQLVGEEFYPPTGLHHPFYRYQL